VVVVGGDGCAQGGAGGLDVIGRGWLREHLQLHAVGVEQLLCGWITDGVRITGGQCHHLAALGAVQAAAATATAARRRRILAPAGLL
jgi:hypothetical protein